MSSRDLEIYKLKYKIEQLEKVKSKYEELLEKQEGSDYKTRLMITGLERNISKRKIRLSILKQDDLLKDEEIALINKDDSLEGKYSIYRVEDGQRMGYITYSPEDEEDIGSIGYSIMNPFRGHEYAYKSLKLLSGYLSVHGISSITIAAIDENIPSVKTMEKFRKDVESKDLSRGGVKRYTYTLTRNEEE